jgi:two-component system alkaline phosphatase synthesis response regulator PhoP
MATRILLVEDEPILVSLYALALSQHGYEVTNALDLASGEEKVIVLRPHVVLLDLLIPQRVGAPMESEDFHEPLGFQILKLIKSSPSLKETRVIVLSNLDTDEHIQKATDLGADAYIVKANLDPHDLQAHVENILHSNRPQQLG